MDAPIFGYDMLSFIILVLSVYLYLKNFEAGYAPINTLMLYA
jgi:hypothetical protein